MEATVQEKAHVNIEHNPEWQGLMDKQLVALVIAGKVDYNDAAAFVFARKVRKYS